jgi:methyltransferase (TIGR00027 family)
VAKTGTDSELGTAENALRSRALHALHDEDPILDDHWAVELLVPQAREAVRSGPGLRATPDFDPGPIFAGGVACLRYAEDEVERCAARGFAQYVILGAGFDTFALRKGERLRVFEVDHPDVQALKRARIAAAERKPAALPEFVPVDFEIDRLAERLRRSGFDAGRPAVFSWLNTLPYLTREATVATLADLGDLAAPGSRLVVNYAAQVPLTREQTAYLARLAQVIGRAGEPFRSGWPPAEFETRLAAAGFRVVEHASEADLTARYFAKRRDGLAVGVPVRIVTAERI